MNSFMSWIGGKKALRDEIVVRFPARYSRYIEVFGGGGWVLFHKAPGKDFEVYNDFNPNLTNLYRCVRDHPDELCDELRYTLNSRADFDHIRNMLHSQTEIPDIKRAAYFYQLIRESYASGLDSFASQPHSMWNNFPLIHEACRRLQKVVIENKDFEKLIKQYDRPESFFYCDPPYYETEDISPEMHIANSIVKAMLVGIFAVPTFFIFPLLTPVVIALAVFMYFRESKGVANKIKAKRKASILRSIFMICRHRCRQFAKITFSTAARLTAFRLQ